MMTINSFSVVFVLLCYISPFSLHLPILKAFHLTFKLRKHYVFYPSYKLFAGKIFFNYQYCNLIEPASLRIHTHTMTHKLHFHTYCFSQSKSTFLNYCWWKEQQEHNHTLECHTYSAAISTSHTHYQASH